MPASCEDSVNIPDDALTFPTLTVPFVADETAGAVIPVSALAIIDMVMAPDAANAITSGLICTPGLNRSALLRMG